TRHPRLRPPEPATIPLPLPIPPANDPARTPMLLKNTRTRWGGVSQALHWIVVALVLAMAWIGLTMGDLPNGPDKVRTFALHKSIGLTILALVVLRIGW